VQSTGATYLYPSSGGGCAGSCPAVNVSWGVGAALNMDRSGCRLRSAAHTAASRPCSQMCATSPVKPMRADRSWQLSLPPSVPVLCMQDIKIHSMSLSCGAPHSPQGAVGRVQQHWHSACCWPRASHYTCCKVHGVLDSAARHYGIPQDHENACNASSTGAAAALETHGLVD
jgi:Tfp pilus assembly protein PilV